MATDLKKFLEAYQPEGEFQPYCVFSRKADALTFYFKPDAEYSRRLTDHVTLFLSVETDALVGCRIKGISGIIEDLPNYLSVNHGAIDLSVVFLPFRGTSPDADTRSVLNALAKEASDRGIKLEPEEELAGS